MNRYTRIMLRLLIAGLFAQLAGNAYAQRRTATEKVEGEAATIVYRQDFNDDENLDNFYSDNGRVLWSDSPAGAFGSSGAMKLLSDGGIVGCERILKWVDEDSTIVFAFYAHGITDSYFQAKGAGVNKNLHAYFKITEQDTWCFAKFKASSMTGFGGGGGKPGETFTNLQFVIEATDKAVDAPFLLIDDVVIFSGDDGKKPTAPPSGLGASYYADGKCVSLNWDVAKDDVGVYKYEVHRSDEADFQASTKTRISSISDNYYEDRGAKPGSICYYRIVGIDAGGFAVESDTVKFSLDANAEIKGAQQAAGTMANGAGDEF
jgi:hypothetical protein